MPDTKRSLAALKTLLADNVEGRISPQDIRDAIVSVRPNYGRVSQQDNGIATVIIDTTSFFKVNVPGTELHALVDDFDMPTAGRLRYIGEPDGMCLVLAKATADVTGANIELRFRLGKNDLPIGETEAQVMIGVGLSMPDVTMTMVVELGTNDYIEMYVRNLKNTNNVTITHFSLQAIGYIM